MTPIFASHLTLPRRLNLRSQLELNSDNWSDSEDEAPIPSNPTKEIAGLRRQLATARQGLAECRALLAAKLEITDDLQEVKDGPSSKHTRDDDTHYFESYAANGMS